MESTLVILVILVTAVFNWFGIGLKGAVVVLLLDGFLLSVYEEELLTVFILLVNQLHKLLVDIRFIIPWIIVVLELICRIPEAIPGFLLPALLGFCWVGF